MTTISVTFHLAGPMRTQVQTVGDFTSLTFFAEGGSVQFVSDSQELHQMVVDADMELNREREQRGDDSG